MLKSLIATLLVAGFLPLSAAVQTDVWEQTSLDSSYDKLFFSQEQFPLTESRGGRLNTDLNYKNDPKREVICPKVSIFHPGVLAPFFPC